MIQLLAARYQKTIAFFLLMTFYISFLTPLYGASHAAAGSSYRYYLPAVESRDPLFLAKKAPPGGMSVKNKQVTHPQIAPAKTSIGGPGQPEMASFKSIGTDNMVNLFSGDFSYNIPLLDVGGYPINIFYDGGVGMEQEASWVGLGWNINPGNINRNVRGIPDDFDGTDTLVQRQNMKPNITWGASLGGDVELVGIKKVPGLDVSFGASLGVSFNNYLGPALDLGVKGGVSFKVAGKVQGEKGATDTGSYGKVGVSLSGNIGSRTGVTLSPGVSFTATSFLKNRSSSFGLSAATSYNSRYGLKELQISEQMSFSRHEEREHGKKDKDGKSKPDRYSSSNGGSLFGTSISFTRPSYVPSIRMPVTNEAYSGHFQVGFGIMGGYASVEAEVYKQTASVASENITQRKPMVGYMYYEKAVNNPAAVMDFTRFNDKEVTAHTPVISVPQYSYDVFSVQGEGTGGSIRAYRNDLGSVRDNYTSSKDKSLGAGADIGIPGHYGANINIIKTPSTIGEWNAGNKLHAALAFNAGSGGLQEKVYFRNPGESSVQEPGQFDRIGGTDLVRFKLGGSGYNPTVEPQLERFSTGSVLTGTVGITTATNPSARKKRTQVISFLTADEAARVGLDKQIKSYNSYTLLDGSNNLQFYPIDRVSGYRKAHHISQINVTEGNGRRYVYGIPVYNTIQKDFTFSVDAAETDVDRVAVSNAAYLDTNSPLLGNNSNRDGYVQVTETPAYAHSFLLSGLLSPDYTDLTGDGITDDDPGEAVKFNYSRVRSDGDWAVHKWRTPLTTDNKANFNAGNRSEARDDKGIISYGERESWYTHSIESKTMIAVFTLENRKDGKGTLYTYGGRDNNDTSLKRLKQIDLYSKADLKKNGMAGARPVKTVHFGYSYTLCTGTPDNYITDSGKLTLDSIWFTFNGQSKINKNKYVFSYVNSDTSKVADNPVYEMNGSDRWGNYKPKRLNPAMMKNSDYPFSLQDKSLKDSIDRNAGAWSLKRILLPSGGQIEVQYESDDYAFVQNKRASDMMQVLGFGKDSIKMTSNLYGIDTFSMKENLYLFVKVPEACTNKKEVYLKYLQGLSQLCVKFMVNMPKGPEYLTSYATFSDSAYGIINSSTIWIKMDAVDGLSPLALTALEYLREQLPGQAFPGYDVSESAGLQQVGEMLAGMWNGIKTMFTNPIDGLRSAGKAQSVILTKSFIRLNDPDGFKYGGGLRVKSIKLKDNWAVMTKQYTSVYGQTYDYTTSEVFNGVQRTISSGVASYEPSIGGEENPFQSILQVSNKLPLGPASYGSVEMPVMDAFFPAPSVGYSKITVKSLKPLVTDTAHKSRSGIGKQVTEFYTAKDFPVYYSNTPLSDKQSHQSSMNLFFYKYGYDYRALSQGFLVATNDMHGKMKSQSSYAENDENTRINYSENFYRNTGGKGLNEKFNFAYADRSGGIDSGNIGIDIELMTDTREFRVKSNSVEVQAQVDLFPVFLPIWLPFVWPVFGNSENTYRAVTTTKVINYHSVLDSVLVIDKGSQVSTKNMIYDAETGNVIVNRTNNEFNRPIYTTTYPAYWAYSGMGLAYKNIDAVITANFYDGKITTSGLDQSIFESGDELYIYPGQSWTTPDCIAASGDAVKLWAFDTNKNSTALTVPSKNLVFLDKDGKLYTGSGVKFRIIRSGKRNMLDASVASVVTMANPVATVSGALKLSIGSSSKVVNATAIEFREKWQVDNDQVNKYSLVYDPANCTTSEVIDCNGYLEKNINPYVKGLIGNIRPWRSKVFYGNRLDSVATVGTNILQNGFLANFSLYWDFNSSNNLVPDASSAKWVWNNQLAKVNAKGQELETFNALNIYTAAQYGYAKSIPVAIASNSRYDEMAYEGFEDNNYSEFLSQTVVNNCAPKHINLTNLSNAQIINEDSTGFNAHSGKYMLGVKNGASAMATFNVRTASATDYSMPFVATATKSLQNLGLNFDYFDQFYTDNWVITSHPGPVVAAGDRLEMVAPNYQSTEGYSASIGQSQYIEVTANGYYRLFMSAAVTNYKFYVTTGINISRIDGLASVAYATTLPPEAGGESAPPGYETTFNNDIFLCKGVYQLQWTYTVGAEAVGPPVDHPQATFACLLYSNVSTNTIFPAYKNYETYDDCHYTLPVPGTDSMLNPVFGVHAGKKMIFSAWVHEKQCVNCVVSGYTNNEVDLQFNAGTNPAPLKPSGPIIEGWQRYEGEFTVPPNATIMNMYLKNNSSDTIYFDDIRMHPYNANMKSYVYDPVNLRLTAEMDANNYATFYEYDEEGTLIRTKAETRDGIKTISETRSAKQKKITTVQ